MNLKIIDKEGNWKWWRGENKTWAKEINGEWYLFKTPPKKDQKKKIKKMHPCFFPPTGVEQFFRYIKKNWALILLSTTLGVSLALNVVLLFFVD